LSEAGEVELGAQEQAYPQLYSRTQAKDKPNPVVLQIMHIMTKVGDITFTEIKAMASATRSADKTVALVQLWHFVQHLLDLERYISGVGASVDSTA
jgi:hypothetical protein